MSKPKPRGVPTQAKDRVWDYRCTFVTLKANMECARCGEVHKQTQAEAIADLRKVDEYERSGR